MRHKLTPEQQAAGLRKAIAKIARKRISPKWLLPGMRRYLEKLEREAREAKKSEKDK